ncbi:hypothetical protein [Thermus brockianus]|uniref:ASCH domain-containing protein n=1 Tax=Thermus brockianus TaxID=56956 RepID=A0ABM7XGY6_THEBO|nr:hypothetical protein [Thermus brockianus]BDG15547.1 hypothetical protein TbrSNM41_02810 [Thermus brockianus]
MRIPFRADLYEKVASGEKTATIRDGTYWARRLRPGQKVELAFGRRDRPKILPALVREIVVLDMTPEVELARAVLEAPTDEEAERLWEEAVAREGSPSEYDAWRNDVFEKALQDSGNDPWDLLFGLAAANPPIREITIIWWDLLRESPSAS